MKTRIELHDKDTGKVTGLASVEPQDGRNDPGDLIIGLRRVGSHPDQETCIVTIACDEGGAFDINVLTADGDLLHHTVVQA